MSMSVSSIRVRIASVIVAVAAVASVGAVGQASADVRSGTYTSTTLSGSTVLLQRTGYVRNGYLVLIGRYKIHPTRTGGYVDFFPGHRVFMNSDGHGGYRGPAYLGGGVVGTFKLTPRR